MWPYVVLIILPILIHHISIRNHKIYFVYSGKNNHFAIKLFWVILLILLIFRNKKVGIDLVVYERIFDNILISDWASALGRSPEIGNNFLNKAVSIVTEDFRWVMIISAIFSVSFIAKAYSDYTTDDALTIALFVNMSNFILLFSGLKQCIAISLGFCAFELTRQKKVIPFIMTVILAMLFHTSAFMIIFMYPIYHVRIKRSWLIWLIPLLASVYAFNQQIFTFLGIILNVFTDYDTAMSFTGSTTMLILFILFAIFSFVIPNEATIDSDTIGMRNFLLFSVALQMFAPLHFLAMRMNYYYIAFIPILIPRIIKYRNNRWNQVAIIARYIMLVFFIFYFFATAPQDNVLQTFPYYFYWQNVF